jgi:hypothetical protein
MTETLRKRGREHEVLPDSIDVPEPKRLHAEKTDRFLQLLQFDKTLADEEEEECAPSEELVNGVMRSLEEEIAGTSSTSYLSSNFGDNSAASEISSDHAEGTVASDSGMDLCYLLEASDNELGIPPSPVLNWKDEVCKSPKKTSESLWETPDLKSLGENWHFEDDMENYQQFVVYEDAWDANQDYTIRDFVSQDMLFDAEFFAPWRL